MQKFGRTLMLLLFVFLFIMGAKMAIKVFDPYIRRGSASLADALRSV